MAKKPYLDRHVFHNELAVCKRANELSKTALEMFKLLATETSRDFFFDAPEDKEDAIAHAMHDLYRYWRNFKESNVVQLQLLRNFDPEEGFAFTIHNFGTLTYRACAQLPVSADEPLSTDAPRYFLIGQTINQSLKHLSEVLQLHDGPQVAIFVDKIKSKITLMDKCNGDDLSVRSCVDVLALETAARPLTGEGRKMDPRGKHFFKPPPNGFSYFTSIVRNGIIKSINKTFPKEMRSGKRVSLHRGEGGAQLHTI